MAYFSGHSCCWGISVKEYNYSKHKWGNYRIERGIEASILRNGEVFYSFPTNDFAYAVARAQVLMVLLQEHPIMFSSHTFKKDLEKRPIYYSDTACIITYYGGAPDQRLHLLAVNGEKFRQPRHWDDDNEGVTLFEEGPESLEYTTDIFDENIYWFREPKEPDVIQILFPDEK